MKKIVFSIAMFLCPLLSFSQINYQLNIDKSDIKTSTKDNYDLIEITGYDNAAITAAPSLPLKKLNFIIPAGQKVSDIKINIIQEEILLGTFRIYPVQPEHITSYEWLNLPKMEFTEPDSSIYKKNKIYPSYVFENTGFQYVSGATIASIIFNPIRYNPVTGIVKYIRAVDISLFFEDSNDLSVKPIRLSERSYHILKKRLKSLVENPSDVDLYFQVNNIEGSQNKTESFNSSEIPSLVGSNIDYVIITNETLKTKFEQISAWKTKKGLPSVVRTVEWIDENYAGCDESEKIRNFIIDANTKWGAIWFLLGGDDNIVPLRYAWHSHFDHWQLSDLIPNGEFIPTDMYYACLDGNWNSDGDATFGEGDYDRHNDGSFTDPPTSGSIDIDNVDLAADVFVGRIPVQNELELDRYITKYFEYIKNSAGNENNILLFSADSDDISSSQMNYVYNEFPAYTNRTRLYENYSNDKNDVLDALNAFSPYSNYHIICGYGHGSPYNFEACVGNISSSEFDILQNNDRSEIMYLNHCSTMAWDKDCVGEHFIDSENGGVVFIGNTRFGWTGDPAKYNDEFIKEIYSSNYNISQAFLDMKFSKLPPLNSYYDNTKRWGQLALNISADPEMPVWTDNPDNLIVSHPSSVANGENNFTVTINNLPSGQEAVICLKKDMEDYAFQPVTGTGSPVSANFIFTPDTPGNLDVTVTTHNFIPYEGVVPVNISVGAHLFVADNFIDDDDAGPSSGNSDGQIDAGETIELTIILENSGSQNAANVTAILSCGSPYITITQYQSGYGNINTGLQALSQNKYIFQVDANTPDDESIEFTLNIQDNVPNNYQDKFYIQVGAPELDHIKNIVIANSQIDIYQSVNLNLEFLNIGDAQATGISATLLSSAYYVYILDGTASFPDIDAYTSSQSSDPFRFMVDYGYSGQPIPFTVNVTNEYGKSWIYNFEIDDPSGVGFGTINFSGYLNEIDLWWDPVSGIRGYNIYRSDTETGAYEKINVFIVEGTSYFKDMGLVECSDYFYKISTVDTSENESDLTAPFKAWTTLPYYADWPVTPSNSGNFFGPVKLANIDSESDLEIIAGNTNKRLYAWKHDSNELYDIDNNPTTVSGFYNIEGSVWGAPAIGDINNDGIDEIIVTTRNVGTNSASVFAFQNVDDGSGKPEMIWTTHYKMLNGGLERASIRGAVLADLENDGYMEIIVQTEPGDIFILDHQGNDKAGYWPVFGDQGQYGTPLVIDTNGDGYKEIIAGFKTSNNIKIWDYQGNEISDFSCDGWVVSPLVAANLDNDSEFEILYMTTSSYGWGHVYAINPDGSFVPGWSIAKVISLSSHSWHPTRPPSLVVADLDDDGIEEIICGGYGRFYIWDKSGTLILDRPVPGLNVWDAQPILADLDEDDDLEILISSKNNSLYAFDIDGGMLLGWPVRTSGEISSTAVVGDINNDGKNEVVCGSGDGNLHIWQTEGSPKFNEITTSRYNNLNNGVYIPKKAGLISSNQTWSGTINIIGDITISNSITLTINPGTILLFKDNTKLIVNGTLNADGAAFTSAGSQSAGAWYGLVINGDADIDNCTIEYANRGIYFYNSATGAVSNSEISNNNYGVYLYKSKPTIQDCEISDCHLGIYLFDIGITTTSICNNDILNNDYYGIYLYNSSPHIGYNNIQNNNYCGIYCYRSHPSIHSNDITGHSSSGVYCNYYSPAYLSYFSSGPGNNLITNNYRGVYANYQCNAFIYWNDIYSNYSYEVDAYQPLFIDAEYNWWGAYPPDNSEFNAINGATIDYTPSLDEPVRGGKSQTSGGDIVLNNADCSYWDGSLDFALQYQQAEKYDQAIEIYEQIVKSDMNSEKGRYALVRLDECYRLSAKKGFISYLDNSVRPKLSTKDDLFGVTLELENHWRLDGGEYKTALKNLELLRTDFSANPVMEKYALFNAGLIHLIYLDNRLEAEKVFSELESKHPDDPLVMDSKIMLGNFNKSALNKSITNRQDYDLTPEEFSISQNYPNPFNPTTHIQLDLPEGVNVKLEVYNIRGQKVAVLIDGYREAGSYEVFFDGRRLASGVYFYRVSTPKFTDVKRMLLVK